MAVKTNTTRAKLQTLLNEAEKILNEELTEGLAYLGEMCTKRIRENRTNWTDQTGNLRSSIGYAVYAYAKKQFESDFAPVKDGTAGSTTGKDYVESLAQQYAETMALYVVAGMNYAEYVEAMPNHDVLESTEVWARSELDKVLKVYRGRAERRINKLFLSL